MQQSLFRHLLGVLFEGLFVFAYSPRPGTTAFRLEDDVHLTPEGPRCLTDGRTELLEIH